MKWFSFSLKVVALAVVAALIGSLSVKETAAYGQPTGSATLTGSSTTVSVGGSTELTLTVVNSAGNPWAGKSCELRIFSQPGTDASIIPQDSTKTDANGVLTGSLYVGTTLGTVQVTANCGNLFAGLSVVVVAGAAVAPPQAPVELAPIAMPPTGVGPAADGETYGLGLIIALLAGGSLTLAAGSVLFLRARRVVRS